MADESKPRNLQGILLKNYGPLPGYAWIAAAAVGGFVYLRAKRKGSSSSTAADTSAADEEAALAAQDGYGDPYANGGGYSQQGGSGAGSGAPGVDGGQGGLGTGQTGGGGGTVGTPTNVGVFHPGPGPVKAYHPGAGKGAVAQHHRPHPRKTHHRPSKNPKPLAAR